MSRAPQIVLGGLFLGAAVFGVVQFNVARRLRTELAEMRQERDRLLEQSGRPLNTATIPPAGPDGGGPVPMPSTVATVGPEPSGPAFSVATPANVSRGPGGRFAAMNSPEVQQLMAIQQKAGLDGRYASLFKRLNLSPEALDQLKHLLVERQSVVGDVMAAVRNQGMGGRENRDEIRQLVESTQAEVEDSIREALGESAYAQYRAFEATMPQRGVVEQLGQRLSYSSAPLGDAQAEQLVQILAATAPASAAGQNPAALMPMVSASPRGGMVSAVMGGGARISDETIAQARGILSTQQLAALQSLQQEQQAAVTLMEKMRMNRQNQQSSGGPVPGNPGGG